MNPLAITLIVETEILLLRNINFGEFLFILSLSVF